MIETSLRTQLFIVPASHVRILDHEFQVEMYALFHRRWICRLGHAICTPVVIVGLLAFFTKVHPALGVLAALALFGTYVHFDRRVAAILAAPVALSWLVARACSGQPFAVIFAVTLGAAALQAISHSAEDLPPPWSKGFRPVGEELRRASLGKIVALSLLTFVYFFLELWASPRVWPIQVHSLLLRWEGGEQRRALSQRVRAHVEAAETHWPPVP
ncbi:MAG: hypothetical protein ACXWUG_32080 [Polyangiales bacterium]